MAQLFAQTGSLGELTQHSPKVGTMRWELDDDEENGSDNVTT